MATIISRWLSTSIRRAFKVRSSRESPSRCRRAQRLSLTSTATCKTFFWEFFFFFLWGGEGLLNSKWQDSKIILWTKFEIKKFKLNWFWSFEVQNIFLYLMLKIIYTFIISNFVTETTTHFVFISIPSLKLPLVRILSLACICNQLLCIIQ